MIPEQIEKIKQDYTDKYVKVDPSRPELARFKDVVGQVKTVNMSGRALVEFLDYHLNIGWFDIDLDYLKVVDKPEPKPAEAKKPAPKAKPAAAGEAKKPGSGEKKLSPLEMARQADSGGAQKKPATSDILAKLRGEKGAAAKPAEAKKEAPAKPASDKPGKVDRSKMSVADMLAAARGGAAPAAKSKPAPEPEPEPVAEAPAAESEPAAEAAPTSVGPVDKSSMSIADMIAYCREHDAE